MTKLFKDNPPLILFCWDFWKKTTLQNSQTLFSTTFKKEVLLFRCIEKKQEIYINMSYMSVESKASNGKQKIINRL